MSLSFSIEFMRKIEKLEPDLKEIFFDFGKELEKKRIEDVGREEFDELKGIVRDLAKAQERTEKRVEELAEAQKRTEKRVEELAEAQKRTEKRVEELAEAQRRTEQEIKTLTKELKITRKEVGKIAGTVGYTLENEAYKKLPVLVEKDFGIKMKEPLLRKWVLDNEGKYIEVNIFGSGEKQGKPVTIIGESKAQLSKNDIDRFFRKKIDRLQGLYQDIFMVLVTHMTSEHDVETYAKQKKVTLYYSYHF
ncbi:MAG: chordopoxvirus fusion protein [Candidatus Aminicenantes bacterium]|nr:MAG: chordopoxvirus fusion protein [Candidatus Aminicenantes bacterium]